MLQLTKPLAFIDFMVLQHLVAGVALLAGDEDAKPVKVIEKPKKATRDEVVVLRAEVRKCDERLGKLNEMRDRLAKKLADPELYEASRVGELETWNKKYAEVMGALDRAEAMWLAAQGKLEQATG